MRAPITWRKKEQELCLGCLFLDPLLVSLRELAATFGGQLPGLCGRGIGLGLRLQMVVIASWLHPLSPLKCWLVWTHVIFRHKKGPCAGPRSEMADGD